MSTFNGWKNFQTWAVNAYISGDYEECVYYDFRVLQDEAETVEDLADAIRDFMMESVARMGVLENPLADDLMIHALESVDYYEIAEANFED